MLSWQKKNPRKIR